MFIYEGFQLCFLCLEGDCFVCLGLFLKDFHCRDHEKPVQASSQGISSSTLSCFFTINVNVSLSESHKPAEATDSSPVFFFCFVFFKGKEFHFHSFPE